MDGLIESKSIIIYIYIYIYICMYVCMYVCMYIIKLLCVKLWDLKNLCGKIL